MGYLSKPLGSVADMAFSIGGISQVALVEKAKLSGITYASGSTVDIATLTLASGATFQEIVFTKGSATLEQEQVKSATSHYITQRLRFSVLTEDNAASQDILLGREYVALVRKNSGKWVLVGRDNGLSCSVYTNNSTADDSSRTYEMTADNLGDASNVLMTDAALSALIKRG